ncbi:MAG: ABC-F family ATP-binding cassette domain-containing protein [Nitrospira sp.]|nr:ABC transporter ATP-binding protein [Candidatus Manganitrophaceae bacterium]HIL35720.1 ABC transporter ATP-binding protein [Candidatus Manganitrophaceae bacterium]
MNILDISDLHKSFGPKKIFQGITLTVGETEKVGIIGQNGSGKSTLFQIVAGLEPPDSGKLSFKKGIAIGYLSQNPILNETRTVREELDASLGEIRVKLDAYHAVTNKMKSASPAEVSALLKEQEALNTWLEHHQGWETDHRIDEVLLRLNILNRDEKISVLSGGMRKRVALAKLLLQLPDLLMLDEPTNHLDIKTTEWLEKFLTAYPGAVMLTTHDRYFLDRVVRRIFEVNAGTICCTRGGYSDYLQARAERLLHETRVQNRLVTLLRRESEWMKRGPKARGTKSKARIGRFYQMQDQRETKEDRQIGLHLETGHRLGNTILELVYLNKTLENKLLIKDLSISLKKGDRIGIVGANGCGKTTLLRMILGEMHLSSGKIVLGKNTKISYFDQNRASLDPDSRVEASLGEGYWVTVRGERRHKVGYLAEFFFEAHDHKRLVRTLSGGEKARLILAKIMLEKTNMLILDEPTNDLDIPTLQLLDDVLVNYDGCILMVTHDRFFLDKVSTGILSFEGEGQVRYTEGNYAVYQERLKAEKKDRAKQSHQIAAQDRPPSTGEEKSPNTKKRKGLSYKEKRELEGIETKIENLEARKKELETFLQNPAAHATEKGGLEAWSIEFAEIETGLQDTMDRWEVLESKREG